MSEDFRGPAARRFDWEHIFDRHSENGLIARRSSAKTIFVGPLGLERILYRGTATCDQVVIEFWYNVETRTLEAACPVGT